MIWEADSRAHGSGMPGTASPAETEDAEEEAEADAADPALVGLVPPAEVTPEEPPHAVAPRAVSRPTAVARAAVAAGLGADMGTD